MYSGGDLQMAATMKSTRKALRTGSTAAVSAEMMSRSAPTRPKKRRTRKARTERTTLMGIGMGPRATRERDTTQMSKMFQPSPTKERNLASAERMR